VLPDVPTVAESGVPGFTVALHYGILTSVGTPASIIARLNQEIRRVMTDPTVVARLAGEGAETLTSTPEEFAADTAAELKKWGKVVHESGAHVD
jgi:tripartite-type tricarboxylate transporter receptor subunit TctC